MVGWADAVLLTATYSFPTIPTLLTCRLQDKPLIWSPRGALQASHEWDGARRRSLKRGFERLCALVKPRRCIFHVTAEVERLASLTRFPACDAAVIPNGVETPENLPPREWKPNGVLRLMFISRLDPKKGLERLLAAMPRLGDNTTLDVYGTGEPSYAQSLKKIAEDLEISHRVRFWGHVDGERKLAAFMGADLFVFPTHSENFGMVAAEALAHGVPAVVAHGAPWEDLDARGCGRWISNDVSTLAATIEELRGADLAAMGRRGREWMLADFVWEHRAREMKDLFQKLISERRVK
jgi:glycosyltransferase involved in cell wall biosynthesis